MLRFLGTPEAARELVRHLALGHAVVRWAPNSSERTPPGFTPAPVRDDLSFQLIAGLFGSPHRAVVLDEIERWSTLGGLTPEFARAVDLFQRLRPR